MRALILSLLTLAALASIASAQCGSRVCRPYTPAVEVAETVAAVAVPVLVPAFAFQFLPTYAPSNVPVQSPAPSTTPAHQPDGPPVAIDPAQASAARSSTSGDLVRVEQILRANCAACHTAPGKGGVVIFGADGVFAPNVPAKRIWNAADGQGGTVMPPAARTDPSKAISDADVAVLRQWFLSE